MTIDEIVVNVSPGETRVGFLANGHLIRLVVDRGGQELRVGDIAVGRVTKVLPAIDAAFVNIGQARAGFLGLAETRPVDRNGGRICDFIGEGDRVLVQVLREAEGEKGPKLTARPSLVGHCVVFLPRDSGCRLSRRLKKSIDAGRENALRSALPTSAGGWIIRSAAKDADVGSVTHEADDLISQWRDIKDRESRATPSAILLRAPDPATTAIIDLAGPALTHLMVDDPKMATVLRARVPVLADRIVIHSGSAPLFAACGIEDQVDALVVPEVALPGGGRITISETPALVAIDVDVGAADHGKRERTAFVVNMEAAETLSHQVILRDLAGHIVIDFVPMRNRENGEKVLSTLRRALGADGRPVQIAGFTRLGMVELTRQRLGPSLTRRLTEPCPTCHGGRVKSPATVALDALRTVLAEDRAQPGTRWTLRAPDAVIAALRERVAPALQEAETRLGRRLRLVADATMASDHYAVAPDLNKEGGGE